MLNVELIGVDTVANGFWRGRYGFDGYIIDQQNADHIVIPPDMQNITHGSTTRMVLTADAPMASNPLLLDYIDGSSGNGQSYGSTVGGTQYIPTIAPTTVTLLSYNVRVYVSALDGVSRSIRYSWQTSTASTVYLVDNFSIAGNTAMYRHYIINYTSTDRDIRLFHSENGGGTSLINAIFFDKYQPNSLGGFGFASRAFTCF